MRRGAEVGLTDLLELSGSMGATRFAEPDGHPYDAEVVATTWVYANKDGSRDLRRRDNAPIPLVRYAELALQSPRGLREAWMFSHFAPCEAFVKALEAHKQALAASMT